MTQVIDGITRQMRDMIRSRVEPHMRIADLQTKTLVEMMEQAYVQGAADAVEIISDPRYTPPAR